MSRHLLLLGVIAATCATTGTARGDTDGQIWLAAAVEGSPVKRLSLQFDQQLRIDQNFSRAGEFLSTVTAEYSFTKWFRLGGGYRLAFVKDDSYEVRHRLHADARFRLKVSRLRLIYRLRFQERFAKNNSGETTFRHTLRNKIGMQYRFKFGLRPYASTENFLRLAGNDGTEFRKQRFTVGAEYVWDEHGFDLGYRLEVPLTGDNTLHALLVGYKYSF